MYIPPLTASTCPVIYAASSDARKHAAAATSSAVPRRPSGICAAQSVWAFSHDRARHVGVDQPRRDHVDRDAARRHFPRQRLGEADEPRLRRRVVGLPGIAHLADHRADRDDAPAPLLEHRAHGRLRQREGRRQVRRDHRVPVLALHPHQQLIARDPGVAHDDVEPSVARRRSRPAAPRAPPIGHVNARPPRRVPPAAAMAATVAGGVVAARGGHDGRALRRQLEGNRASDAARRTGHERDLTGEVEHHAGIIGTIRGAIAVEVVRRSEAQRGRLSVNLPHEPAQHGARAHLNIRCDALRRKARARRPPSAPATTPARQAPRWLPAAVVLGSASTLATTGTRGSVIASARSSGASRSLGRLHQRAVERRADRQRHDPPRAERLGALAGARHRIPRARNDDLSRAVQVGRAHHFALRGGVVQRLATRLGHALGIEAENRRHRAGPDRHGLLHVATAPPHDAQRVGEAKRARRDVGRVLAQAVAGDERRRTPLRGQEPQAATLTARMAGWVFSVSVSASSDPRSTAG